MLLRGSERASPQFSSVDKFNRKIQLLDWCWLYVATSSANRLADGRDSVE